MIANKLIWFRHQLYNRIVGKLLPVSWFGPTPPIADNLSKAKPPVQLEIVSHCWNYAHMLNFQLSSLVDSPPQNAHVTYTLFHAKEDEKLKQLIARFEALSIPSITWQFIEIDKPRLFRRAIGRNQAALQTKADWIWFCDCDLIFYQQCLDHLVSELVEKQVPMVFPSFEHITALLAEDHPMLNQSIEQAASIDSTLFQRSPIEKAKGAFQIVHGDVARTCGYCKDIAMYQQPMMHWSKTYEDSIFRRLIGSEGQAIAFDGLYRIRHQEKGRYQKQSPYSRLRRRIRMATDNDGAKA